MKVIYSFLCLKHYGKMVDLQKELCTLHIDGIAGCDVSIFLFVTSVTGCQKVCKRKRS